MITTINPTQLNGTMPAPLPDTKKMSSNRPVTIDERTKIPLVALFAGISLTVMVGLGGITWAFSMIGRVTSLESSKAAADTQIAALQKENTALARSLDVQSDEIQNLRRTLRDWAMLTSYENPQLVVPNPDDLNGQRFHFRKGQE